MAAAQALSFPCFALCATLLLVAFAAVPASGARRPGLTWSVPVHMQDSFVGASVTNSQNRGLLASGGSYGDSSDGDDMPPGSDSGADMDGRDEEDEMDDGGDTGDGEEDETRTRRPRRMEERSRRNVERTRRSKGSRALGERLPDGRFPVCIDGSSGSFGLVVAKDVSGKRKPNGIKVFTNGTCEFSEYAGGFDGFWSADAGDGHENGVAKAAAKMLGDEDAEIGKSAGRDNPVNEYVNSFLLAVREKAAPEDLAYPEDEELADNGKRMENIRKASRACTDLIKVFTNC